LLKECLSAFWKHYYIKRAVDLSTVSNIVRGLMKLIDTGVIVLEDERNYLEKAMEVALKTGITIHDALYIAQELRYGELLTADKKQANAAQQMGVHVHLVT